jgi:hypothetical protein
MKTNSNNTTPDSRPISPVELWMAKSNLRYIPAEGLATVVARLRANGYERVARTVEALVESKLPRSDWQYAVANGDTRLGYGEWVQHSMESNQAEGSL